MISKFPVTALLLLSAVLLPASGFSQADYKRYFDEDNLPGVRGIFDEGRYDVVLNICNYALSRGQPSWEWRTLRLKSLANTGLYEEAFNEAIATAELFDEELGALLEIYEFLTEIGKKEEAKKILNNINAAASAVPKDERTPLDYVRLGKAAIILGADPATVIEQYFSVAKMAKQNGQDAPPGLVEAYLASGDLALAKDDFKLAGSEFQEAEKYEPDNPDVLFGLVRAFMPSDREVGGKYLEKLLESYPMHFGALLTQAEYAINYEKYEEAKQLLDQVESVNPRHPIAHAYRAVLVELELNDDAGFEKERQEALSVWKDNPEIDHLIGRVLSFKYRYQEGAESQKRALAFDPNYLPAKLQLALDYLRLGKVEQAWPLAKEVGEADEYNVLAYNLEILQEEIESFAALTNDDFIVRMPPNEVEVYGDRVLEILTEAKQVLGEKYGLDIQEQTLVEFYPNQQDFAIRSFGSLGGEGLLGVCFGSVVTMNSPGSVTAGRNNWEATLWHEYCHVVTLTATKNRMPRWLSEGISVYEEKQRQSNWGQEMTPTFRRFIIEDNALTRVGDMSQAFFQPESGEHLMFAYYESSLVVEYIVDTYGIEAMRAILADLAGNALINDAIARHTVAMEQLERDFFAYAVNLAKAYGANVDWRKPDPEEVNLASPLAVAAFLKKNPTNFTANQLHVNQMLEQENWEQAVKAADQFIALLPEFTDGGNGYAMKARALREMEDFDGEAAVLEELASRSAEAFSAYMRLVDVNFEKANWNGVLANADRGIAINPFIERTHYCRGCAFEALQQKKAAVDSFETSLQLDPANPSVVRFKLASLLQESQKQKGYRYLLDALADSPRYQEAYSLLVDWNQPEAKPEQKDKAKEAEPVDGDPRRRRILLPGSEEEKEQKPAQ